MSSMRLVRLPLFAAGCVACTSTSPSSTQSQDSGPFEAGGTLVASLYSPVSVAVDPQWAFVTTLPGTARPGAVLRVPLGGGAVATLATGNPGAIAVDDESVFWMDTEDDGGSIRRVAKDGGGAPEVIASSATGNTLEAMALDTTDAYWGDYNGAIWRVGKDGGAPTQLGSVPRYVESLAVDEGNVYAGFWAGSQDGGVLRLGKDGGPPELIVGTLIVPEVLAVDDGGVYVAAGRWPADAGPTGVVVRYDKATGASVTLLSGGSVLFGMAVAGSQLFVAGWDPGQIDVVPATGGKVTTIAGNLSSPTTIAVEQGDVYWIDLGATGEMGDLRVLRAAVR